MIIFRFNFHSFIIHSSPVSASCWLIQGHVWPISLDDPHTNNMIDIDLDSLTESFSGLLRTNLEKPGSIPRRSLKKKHDGSVLWFNGSLSGQKQKSQRIQRIWHSSRPTLNQTAWQDSALFYTKTLHEQEHLLRYSNWRNKHKPSLFFNTVAKLTQNHNCVELCIPITTRCSPHFKEERKKA